MAKKLGPGEQIQVLPVTLTEDEVRVRGQELGALDIRINEFEEDAKARASEDREKLKGMRADRDYLAQVVKSGQEDREVIIVRKPNFEKDVTEIVRTDTGEVVTTVEITEQDRQMSFVN